MLTPLLWLFILLVVPSLVALGIRWIYVPIKIRNAHLPPIQSGLEPTVINNLTPEMREQIGTYVGQFGREGFSVAANFARVRGEKQSRSVQVIFVNRATNDIGVLIFVSINLTRNCVFAIRSEFADGREVATGVNREIGFTPDDPKVETARFSWVRDIATLAEAHRRRLRKLGLENTARIAPKPGEEEVYSNQRYAREINRFVSCGYYWRDEAAGVCRKTLWGIFITAWKLTPPIKGWRMRRRDRQSRKLWNQLGMNEWKPPALPVEALAPLTSASAERPPDAIVYQSALPPGELRISQEKGSVIIRLGKPGIGDYLLMRIGLVVALAIQLFFVLTWSYIIWLQYRMTALVGVPFLFSRNRTLLWLIVLIVAVGLQIRALLRGIRSAGGTAVISATTAGFNFAAAPARVRNGSIVRQDLRNLLVVRRETHLFQSLFELRAMLTENRPHQPLLTATNAADLHKARNALAMAMGIQNAIIPTE